MAEKNRLITSVQAYLHKAHEFLTQAEDLVNQEQSEAERLNDLCTQTLIWLLQAFLIYRGEEIEEEESIDQLFSRCAFLEEDFYALEETIAYLTIEGDTSDAEEMAEKIDAVNEVWDFILSCLPEKYHL
jgi:hypothetical protein